MARKRTPLVTGRSPSRTFARGNKRGAGRAANSTVFQSRAALDFCRAASHSAAMNAFLFDTLRLSRILRDKGHFTAKQAEALGDANPW